MERVSEVLRLKPQWGTSCRKTWGQLVLGRKKQQVLKRPEANDATGLEFVKEKNREWRKPKSQRSGV